MPTQSTARSVTSAVTRSVISAANNLRWAYNFDGVDDFAQLQTRAINPDGDIFINWNQRNLGATTYTRVVVSQQISTSLASREFLLGISTSGQMILQVGGINAAAGSGNLQDGFYEFSLVGTLATLKRNGVVSVSVPFTRGPAREPSAVTTLCALVSGNASTFGNWFAGQVYDVKINNFIWPMADRDQTVQPSIPAGNNMTLFNTSANGWQQVPL